MDGPYYKPKKDKFDFEQRTYTESGDGLRGTLHNEVNGSRVAHDMREGPRDRITGSEIRLLKLRPGDRDEELVGNMEIYSFHRDGSARRSGKHHDSENEDKSKSQDEVSFEGNWTREPPEYEALSYTWGNKKHVGAIKILEQGKMYEIKIRHNLMAALKTLRHPRRVQGDLVKAQEILRNQAQQEEQHHIFNRLKKGLSQQPDATWEYLHAVLSDYPESSLRSLVEKTQKSKPGTVEETEAIKTLHEMIHQGWHKEELPAHRYLWIDAVCIDQDDNEEKSRQIPRMSDIYQKAKEVCVWLGEDTDESMSGTAMAFVTEVLENWEHPTRIMDDSKESHWDAFINLLRRPWFSRRWIVQELTRAKQATVYCGPHRVKWENFADVISLFKQYQVPVQDLFKRSVHLGNDPERIGDLDELSAIRLVHASDHLFRRNEGEGISEKLLPLEGLMSTLTAFEAAEPKDTVYAIIWLAKDATPVSKQAFTLNWKRVGKAEAKLDMREGASCEPSRQVSHVGSPESIAEDENGSEHLIPELDLRNVDSELLRSPKAEDNSVSPAGKYRIPIKSAKLPTNSSINPHSNNLSLRISKKNATNQAMIGEGRE